MSDMVIHHTKSEREWRKDRLDERLRRLPAAYLHEVLSVEEALVYAQTGEPPARKRKSWKGEN
ncbi:MAG: hypothetical protein LBD08_03465 [Treponema sp.]|jgi:hypothetical protein|nr:hypothetical protein [Treponema sp.]